LRAAACQPGPVLAGGCGEGFYGAESPPALGRRSEQASGAGIPRCGRADEPPGSELAAREILESIEKEEPKLAISIRDQMFRFDDFLEVPEQELRELMNSIDKKTLMVALKGASEDLRSHFYRTMSSRAVEMMKEDSEMMGPVRNKDVAKAQSGDCGHCAQA
jgi:hypothetical protein